MKHPWSEIKCCLLDMDGTIYLSENSPSASGGISAHLIDGAAEFLNYLDNNGIRRIFLTNNSSKSAKDYLQKLDALGIHAELDQVFTSGEATRITLKKRKKGAMIYLMGTPSLEEEFMHDGFQVITEHNIHTFTQEMQPDYVVLGFDTTLSYEKIYRACNYIRSGIPFIATHPDINCPLVNGACMPDTGAMIKLFESSTGISPEIIGKPHSQIIEAITDKYKLNLDEIIMVGDRLYTDIQMAKNAHIKSVLVLSGETKKEDLKNSSITPDFVCESVKELHEMFLS